MKDVQGKEVQIGDKVAYTLDRTTRISIAEVIGFSQNGLGDTASLRTKAKRKISRGNNYIIIIEEKL